MLNNDHLSINKLVINKIANLGRSKYEPVNRLYNGTIRFQILYKTTCASCQHNLNSYYKYCVKCGTYNQVDIKATVILNSLLVGVPVTIIVLIFLMSNSLQF